MPEAGRYHAWYWVLWSTNASEGEDSGLRRVNPAELRPEEPVLQVRDRQLKVFVWNGAWDGSASEGMSPLHTRVLEHVQPSTGAIVPEEDARN